MLPGVSDPSIDVHEKLLNPTEILYQRRCDTHTHTTHTHSHYHTFTLSHIFHRRANVLPLPLPRHSLVDLATF